MQAEIDIDDVPKIFILSALDRLLQHHRNHPQMTSVLLEQKHNMLNLIEQGKITAKKYKKLVGTGLKSELTTVKECATKDTGLLTNPKDKEEVEKWFRKAVETSKGQMGLQENINKSRIDAVSRIRQTRMGSNVRSSDGSSPIKRGDVEVKPANVSVLKKEKEKEPIQSSVAKSVKPEPEVKKSVISSSVAKQEVSQNSQWTEGLVSYKAIDEALSSAKQDKQKYAAILSHKESLLRKGSTADNYKQSLEDVASKTQNESIKAEIKNELDDLELLHDGDTIKWYKQLVNEAKESLEEQKQHLKALQSGVAPKSTQQIKVQPKKTESVKDEAEDELIEEQEEKEVEIDLKEVVSFKVLDELMLEHDQDSDLFCGLYERKKRMLDGVQKGSINATSYKTLLQKTMKVTTNESIKTSMEFELDEIEDMHDGNEAKWFEEILQNTKDDLKMQTDTYQQFKNPGEAVKASTTSIKQSTVNKSIKKSVIKGPEVYSVIKSSKAPAKPEKQEEQKVETRAATEEELAEARGLFSLRAIDDWLMTCDDVPARYCALFERKKELLSMMQQGKVTPKVYYELQVRTFKKTKNIDLKDIIHMDLEAFDDEGKDLNAWFRAVVDDTGLDYEGQEETYERLRVKDNNSSGGTSLKSLQNQLHKTPLIGLPDVGSKPVIKDVICFSAFGPLFDWAVQHKDIIFHKELKSQQRRLTELVVTKKLTAQKYRKLTAKSQTSTKHDFLKAIAREEQRKLRVEHNNEEPKWWKHIVELLRTEPPEIEVPASMMREKVNKMSVEEKMEYLLRAMGKYESLYSYYINNKLPIRDNDSLEEYVSKTRKEGIRSLKIIQEDKDFDVFSLADQLFPPPGEDSLPSQQPPAKEQIIQYAKAIKAEMEGLNEYTKSIKRSTNSKNLEKAKQQIAQCQDDIKYISQWLPNSGIIFPKITTSKVIWYNVDINENLNDEERQVEFEITQVEGADGDLRLVVEVEDMPKAVIEKMVKKNSGLRAKTIFKMPNDKHYTDLIKGNNTHMAISVFQTGFFGGETCIGANRIECKAFSREPDQQISTSLTGSIRVQGMLRVRCPTRPITRQVTHVQVLRRPEYRHQKFIEDEFIKKHVMFVKPTRSQIRP